MNSTLGYGKQISVNEIARHLKGKTALRHKIKSVDRFVGNNKINKDIKSICCGISYFLFSNFKELCVLIDWSGCCQEGAHVLQASVAVEGRSLPIYFEVHAEKDTENTKVHNKFLENLREVIPPKTKIIIVTDAGFHRDWFNKVTDLGWDYVGRVYSKYQYKLENSNDWKKVANIKFSSRGNPENKGVIQLGKTKKQLQCNLYTYKPRLSGKKHKKNKYPDHEKAHSNSYRSGWVIVSSLDKPARHLIAYYKKRMQIEQNFRDMKNQDLGMGLRRNKSKSIHRAEVLYFIAMLSILLLWWIGFCGENAGLHRKYQANTIKTHRVISLVNLGKLILMHDPNFLIWHTFKEAKKALAKNYVKLIKYDPSLK